MSKRPSLAVWLACTFLFAASCDDDDGGGGPAPTQDAGPGGDGDGDGKPDGGPVGDGDGDGDGDAGGGGDGDVDTGAITGFVYDTSVPPVGLKDVMVTGPNNKSAMTTEGGAFVIDDMPVGKDIVLTTKNNEHTQALKTVTVVKSQTSYVDIVVGPVVTGTFDPTKGGAVKAPDGAGVTFPPNSLVTKDGADPAGDVTVAVGALEPTKSQQLKAFPGKAVAKNMSDQAGLIETYSPMEVRAVDSEGKELQIKSGQKADLDFPVSADLGSAPEQIDLYTLLENTGTWRYDGIAVKTRDEFGRFLYRAQVSHMTWWTCGTFTNEVTCVRGCVKNASGDAVAGAEVSLTGLAMRLRDTQLTDAQGCFAANVPQDRDIVVLAASGNGVSAGAVHHTDTTGKFAEDDPAACENLGDIELADRPAEGPCPTGYTQCTGSDQNLYCLDLKNDPVKCGDTCDTAVYCGSDQSGANGPYYSTCINGECVCPPGWTACNGSCVNTATDPYHCGACNSDTSTCNYETEICNNGTCVELTCSEPTELCSAGRGPVCANVQTSVNHCGACGERCGSSEGPWGPGGPFQCVGGQCECSPGHTKCTPYSEQPDYFDCVNTQIDENNCGSCYQQNDVTNEAASCDYHSEVCEAGTCTAITCPGAGSKACYRQCINVATDQYNCGDCGSFCNPTGGKVCRESQCQCPAGWIECFGTCYDPQTDETQCGGCVEGGGGESCLFDQECVAGNCEPLDCPQGQGVCDDHTCNDLQSDENNCGACDNVCAAAGVQASTCVGGLCTCPNGTDLCGTPPYQYCGEPGSCPPTQTADGGIP